MTNVLRKVVRKLDPKYNFDAKEPIRDLALRMEQADWDELKHAIKYPRGKKETSNVTNAV